MALAESDYIPYHAEQRLGRGRALVFAPHPDDEVFGCAGAIIQHVADGDAVKVIIVTDGGFGAGDDGGRYIKVRQQESRAAASVLGYGEPVFWGLPDRGLVFDDALVQNIQAAIAEFAPQFVYAPSWWEIHPDHIVLSQAVTEALRRMRAAAALVLYEVGVPLHPNVLLNITGWLQKKKAALACFGSQLAQQAYDDHILALNRYRSYTLPAGVEAAEGYRRIDEPANLSGTAPAPWMSLLDGQSMICSAQCDGDVNAMRLPPSRWGKVWQQIVKVLNRRP